jgi:peptidoglycan LD-endopeptidase CwlK
MTKTQIKILIGLVIAFSVTYVVVKRKEIENFVVESYRDAKTALHLMSLHPHARKRFADFISAVEKELGYRVFITSSLRSFEKQAKIASGEGKQYGSQDVSQHNFGFAIDINAYGENGLHISSKSNSSQWKPIVTIASRFGITWGGNWSKSDPVHFEYKVKPASELLALYSKGKKDNDGYVLLA